MASSFSLLTLPSLMMDPNTAQFWLLAGYNTTQPVVVVAVVLSVRDFECLLE